jgi:hypothetical protein
VAVEAAAVVEAAAAAEAAAVEAAAAPVELRVRTPTTHPDPLPIHN